MKRLVVYVSLLGFVFLAACKPELAVQSPLAAPPLSSVETRSTEAPSPIPTPTFPIATRTPSPDNMIVHILQPGDTIMGLALQYNVPIEQIYQLNSLSSDSLLSIGQELIIGERDTAATATPLPLLTAGSLPTIVPPLSPASASNPPALAEDLLYVRDGKLIRWNHLTGQQEILGGPDSNSRSLSVQPVSYGFGGPPSPAGYILAYSTSADHQRIAVYRFASELTNYDLGLLDLNTRHVTVFYEGISQGNGLLAMSVSPDGKYVAWVPQDLVPAAGQERSHGLAAPVRGGGLRTGSVFVAPLNELDQKREVGHCGSQQTREYEWGCKGLLWSPDSQSIAWADGNGVWLVELGGTPRQLTQTAVTMPDKHQAQGVYTLRQWSSSGRYILLQIGHYEGSSFGILDVETGQTVPLPDSYNYAYSGPVVTWMKDERLFVGRPGRVDIDLRPSLETWRMDVSNGMALTMTHGLTLNVSPENAPVGLGQKADGQLALALVNRSNSNYTDRGLYFGDSHTWSVKKVNGLPPMGMENIMVGGSLYSIDVLWTTDGHGALIVDRDSQQVLYASTTEPAVYDLGPLLGKFASSFHWID